MIQQMLAKDLRPVTGRNEQRARRGIVRERWLI